tara:strand:- start:562 stop:1239 length:678 start_codon:yes stop_codon:yes gene_type:complete
MEKLNKFSKIFYKLYYNIFVESFKEKLHFNFPSNYFRWDLIEYLIGKYKYTDYLEIGCDQDELFSKIKIKNKVGVDPKSGGNVRKTSDEFFKDNKKKFDIIFIDGLHTFKQVKNDILNSINCLKEGGIVLVHDCMPDCLSKQAVPRYRMIWNGDVWKAIVDLRQREDLEIFTCEMDQGIGIIKKEKNSSILKIEKPIDNLKFKDYYSNYREFLRVISVEELKKKY